MLVHLRVAHMDQQLAHLLQYNMTAMMRSRTAEALLKEGGGVGGTDRQDLLIPPHILKPQRGELQLWRLGLG